MHGKVKKYLRYTIGFVKFCYLCRPVYQKGPDGGIGRRAGLKHQWPQGCAGSTPAPGTKNKNRI